MFKKLLGMGFIAFIVMSTFRLEASTIVGFIYYEGSQTPVIGAQVFSTFNGDSALTDRNGWFSIKVDSLESEELEIMAGHCETIFWPVANKYHHRIELKPTRVQLPVMLIRAVYNEYKLRQNRDRDFHRMVKIEKRVLGETNPWLEELLQKLEFTPISLEMGVQGEMYILCSFSDEAGLENPEVVRSILPALDQRTMQILAKLRAPESEELEALRAFKALEVQDKFLIPIRFEIKAE